MLSPTPRPGSPAASHHAGSVARVVASAYYQSITNRCPATRRQGSDTGSTLDPTTAPAEYSQRRTSRAPHGDWVTRAGGPPTDTSRHGGRLAAVTVIAAAGTGSGSSSITHLLLHGQVDRWHGVVRIRSSCDASGCVRSDSAGAGPVDAWVAHPCRHERYSAGTETHAATSETDEPGWRGWRRPGSRSAVPARTGSVSDHVFRCARRVSRRSGGDPLAS